jgi:hypothetical protein
MFSDKSWDQFIKTETQQTQEDINNKDPHELSDDSDTFYSVEKDLDNIEPETNNTNLISRIKSLTQKEKFHILSILRSQNTSYTKNSYGYFFDLSNIDEEITKKIVKCLELIEMNRDIIKEIDKKRSDTINYYKKLIEEKIKQSLVKNKKDYYQKLKLKDDTANIYSIRNRIMKLKKKIVIKEDDDIDIIIKNHRSKYDNFPKGSVYSDIIEKMKKNNKTVIKYILQDNVQNNYDLIDSYDMDCSKEIDEDNFNQEIEETIDDNDDLEQGNYQDDNHDNDDDENDANEQNENDITIENDYGNDQESDEYHSEENVSNENEQDIETEQLGDSGSRDENDDGLDTNSAIEKSIEQKDKNKKLMFYKNLLFKHGFVFKQNSSCDLVFQSYIV